MADDVDSTKAVEPKPGKQPPAVKKAAADQTVDQAQPEASAKPAAASEVKAEAKVVKKEAAAKPAKPAAPPDPRVIKATATAEQIKMQVERSIGAGAIEEVGATKEIPILRVRPDRWRDVTKFLHDAAEHDYDLLEAFAGTDYKDYIEVVAYLYSVAKGTSIHVKTRTSRDNGHLPSLTSVYNGANWEEREVYDLLGVTFDGHPDMRRIMMVDEWNGHPLRKDFSEFENVPAKGGDHK